MVEPFVNAKFIPSLFYILQFVMEIWRFMELKGVSMNDICSSLMIEALCKGGYLEEVNY